MELASRSLRVCLSTCLSICLSVHQSICLSVCLSVYLCTCASVCLCVYVLTHARGVYFSVNMRECRGLSQVFVCMYGTHAHHREKEEEPGEHSRPWACGGRTV